MDYIKPIPKIGDNRYSDWFHKPAFDLLRVEYYKHFSKDLSVNPKTDNNEMFDPNIKEYAYKYILRGYISSLIMLSSGATTPNSKEFLNWKIEKDMLEKEDYSKYLKFMKSFLLQTIGSNFNFIYSYGSLKSYYLAYIPYGKHKISSFELSDSLNNDNGAITNLLIRKAKEALPKGASASEIRDEVRIFLNSINQP